VFRFFDGKAPANNVAWSQGTVIVASCLCIPFAAQTPNATGAELHINMSRRSYNAAGSAEFPESSGCVLPGQRIQPAIFIPADSRIFRFPAINQPCQFIFSSSPKCSDFRSKIRCTDYSRDGAWSICLSISPTLGWRRDNAAQASDEYSSIFIETGSRTLELNASDSPRHAMIQNDT
jgi:hypothetical protein